MEKVKIKDLKVPPAFQYNSLKNSTPTDFFLSDSPFFNDFKQSSINEYTCSDKPKIIEEDS